MLDTTPFYLPTWPLALAESARVAVLLIVALVAGEAARRFRLPSLLGYVTAGVLLGPAATGFVTPEALTTLRPVLDLAFGLLLFELGAHLDVTWLRRNPWLLASSLLEAALGFVAVFVVLRALDMPALPVALIAAVGLSTSPAVVTHLAAELRAEGQLTERLRLYTALNSVYAVLALAMLLAWLNAEYAGDPLSVVLHPLYLASASFLVAVIATGLLHAALRLLGRSASLEAALLCGCVVLVVAVAEALEASRLLATLIFGALARNTLADLRILTRDFGLVGLLSNLLLFTLTGALLAFPGETSVWIAAGAFVAARLAGKVVGIVAFAEPSGTSLRKGALTGLALAPMSTLALVLVQDLTSGYPALPAEFAGTVLAGVALMQLAGPVLMQRAVVAAGESGR